MAKTEEAETQVQEIEASPLKRRQLAKPAPVPLAVSVCPAANDWPISLRELPRQNAVMLEDFGLSKSSLAHYAAKAARGDKVSQQKLEPLKNCFIDMMGYDTEMREVRDEHYNKIPIMVQGDKPGVMVQLVVDNKPAFEVEERSRWGVRGEGSDVHVTAAKSIHPVAANWKRLVETHFYALCTLLVFVKNKPEMLIAKGRKHPEPELAKEAHATLLAKNNKGEYVHPTREAAYDFIQPYLDGKKAEWSGLD